jgi:hypothetical protein
MMRSLTVSNKIGKIEWLQWLLFGVIAAIFVMVSLNTEGYDDEFYNIRYVREMSLSRMVYFMQHEDLHPPLSYIINYFLFKLLGSWNLVRLCSALFFLSALFYLIQKASIRQYRWGILLLLGLNPTIMLWSTGLRWYAYMLPILLLLTAMPKPEKKYYWPWFFGWMLVAGYIGYAGLFLLLPYFLYYWLEDKTIFSLKWKRVLPWAIGFGVLYAYQAYVFVTVHSKMNMTQTANQQVFDLKSTLISYVSSILANQGLFPLSVFGILSIIGTTILCIAALIDWKKVNKQKHWLVFLLGSAIFLVTGIGGKLRNLMLLEPAKNSLFIGLWDRSRKWVLVGFLLLIIGNLAGVYNVLAHRQTTKNAWNLPVAKTLKAIRLQKDTTASEIFFTHHPSYTYYLTIEKEKLISLYSGLYFDSSYIHQSVNKLALDTGRKNFIFLFTYRGRSMEPDHFAALKASVKSIRCDSIAHFFYDKDEEHSIKKRFFPDYPEYQTEVYKLYNVKPPFSSLRIWERNHLNP